MPTILRPSLLFVALSSAPLQAAVIDLNNNGVSDIWEHRYNATALVADSTKKASDFDGDGHSNYLESLAGTDPRDASSHSKIHSLEKNLTQLRVSAAAEPGKSYQLALSPNLTSQSWVNHGPPILATTDAIESILTGQTNQRVFYRFSIVDVDSDNDGVNDWEEAQLDGFDPQNNDSFAMSQTNSDLTAATSQLQALQSNAVTISAEVPKAYEKEQIAAQFLITRSGDTAYPLTLQLHFSGDTDPTKGSAAPTDYQLKTADDTPISDKITIPAGQSAITLFCHPTTDNQVEVPERLHCQIGATNASASIQICDAQNTSANARLFLASLSPEPGVTSSASGLSTILVNGENSIGLVNLSFYGMTSPQTAVHIHIKNPFTGPHVESLPMGQVNEHNWNIRAAHFLNTDQAVLDALFNGQLYINVHSSNYPAGEIRGDFTLTDGTNTFTPPAAAPSIPALTGDALERDIARFLTQSTFGPTPDLIAELKTLINSPSHNGDQISAYTAWLDSQFSTPSPDLEPYIHAADAQIRYLYSIPGSPDFRQDTQPRSTNRRRAWWLLARHAPDQARQRLAFTLSEIFVTSENENTVDTRHYGHASYYDMLKNQGSGSYRNLLEHISTHPIMAQYLSHLRNSKAIYDNQGNVIISPDENYAREIMQLFSIGLVQLHPDGSLKLDNAGLPIPTYAQDDISELSRVFTGWSFAKIHNPTDSQNVEDNTNFNFGNGKRYYETQWQTRLKNFPEYHDNGAKSCPLLGLDIPAGGTGESDLDLTLDYLAQHPNTAPFISKRLIQRLVTSNPSAGYIHRVSQAWSTHNGNLQEVFKAILLDYEARSLEATQAITFGKKKEPIIHAVALMRALDAQSQMPLSDLDPTDTSIADLSTFATMPTRFAAFADDLAKFPADTTRVRISSTDSSLGQTPLASPTVFNWFLPDYSLAGPIANAGLAIPEFQICTETSVVTNINFHYSLIFSSSGIGASEVPNQGELDADLNPHPTYNPYAYAAKDDHILADLTSASTAGQLYLSIMDTNGDGFVSSADTSFDDSATIHQASEAIVNHFDLLLCSGRLQSEYAAGYTQGSPRADNPRDIILHHVANYATYLDDNDNLEDQAKILRFRLQQALYLITTSPQAIIQK
ncbi:DUF1800 family protein [Rubritalea tangerina]|uniref:DUF1800 family protein n=1 Tax=Rubritalea tangerina TaxID=430798 RepID=A0ABW4Z928_9BACT